MSALVGMTPLEIEQRKKERYECAKKGLQSGGAYSPWLEKELERMVDEYESKMNISITKPKSEATLTTKPKYYGVPESSWRD